MIHSDYRLPQPAAKPDARWTVKPEPKPVAGPKLEISGDSLTLSPKADDYARRHAEAFSAKAPPASSDKKLDLAWQIDEATRLSLKPSLKKFKVELKIKF